VNTLPFNGCNDPVASQRCLARLDVGRKGQCPLETQLKLEMKAKTERKSLSFVFKSIDPVLL